MNAPLAKNLEGPIWLHLNDECPKIGSGRRRVTVLHMGRKWVRVKQTYDALSSATRMSRHQWDILKQVTP